MAERKAANKTSRRIIDVSHPDETPPSPTSKEVLITNRPMLRDPMVTDEDQVADPEMSAEGIPSPTAEKTTVKPLSAPVLEDESVPAETGPEAKSKTVKDEKPAAAPTQPATKKSESESEKPADQEVEPEQKVSEKPVQPEAPEVAKSDADVPVATDSIADDKEKSARKDDTPDAEALERAKHEESINKLVDSKQYALPIKTVEQRRSQHVVMLGVVVSILLIAAWLDIALDAGLVHIHGLKAITHFFST